MTLNKQSEKTLKVIDGMLQDSHKGIVRVAGQVMKELAISMGEPVCVQGKRRTVARVMPAFSDQCMPQHIQMDSTIRENAVVAMGEEITLTLTGCEKAKKVLLAPLVPGWIPSGDYELTYLKQKVVGMPAIVEDHISIPLFSGRVETFVVEGVLPQGTVLIMKDTVVQFKGSEGAESIHEKVRYDDVGGLSKEVQRIREIVELPLQYPQLFRALGIEAPRGILLYGPPGTGKTLIARAVASETNAHFIHVDGPEIMHKYYGESEAKLRELFDEAKQKAPSIIFLDEVDAIAPPREEVHGDVEKRVVAQLLALMDGLEARGNVVVLAASNVPDLIDSALRRPGRFDREICINVPDSRGRFEILIIHTRGMSLAADVSLEHLAKITHGFVGADLAALCREAGMYALRRCLVTYNIEDGHYEDMDMQVYMKDFLDALTEVEPSATRSFSLEIPSCSWNDVGGLEPVKERLQSMVEWPMSHPDLYHKFDLEAPRGILLSGPPGSGKTLMARAVAGESGVNFIPVSSPLLFSRWEGEAEKGLHEVFKRARQSAPCILLFDEIDALAATRGGQSSPTASRLVSQLLMELDGIEDLKQVVILGTTNRIDLLDPALLRNGRFDMVLEFPLPSVEDRLNILRVHLQDRPAAEDVDLKFVAENSEGLVGADLKALTDRAAYFALAEAIEGNKTTTIKQEHLSLALDEIIKEKQLRKS